MKSSRISVSLNETDAEVMQLLCQKKKTSMSSLAKKMIEDWLEGYEDTSLSKRADEAFERWEKGGKKTISHEELWRSLGIE